MSEITWIKLVTNVYTNKKINQIRKMKNGDSFFTVSYNSNIPKIDERNGLCKFFDEKFTYYTKFVSQLRTFLINLRSVVRSLDCARDDKKVLRMTKRASR